MPKTKNGGFIINEPDAAAGPYAPKAKEEEKKSGKAIRGAKNVVEYNKSNWFF